MIKISALMFLGLFLFIISAAFGSNWKITTLDNGLKVMILEYRQVPQVNISTVVKVGAKNETSYLNGTTHLLEHLILFRGTENMTGEQVGAEMKKHGAYFNGFTSEDWTDFVISLPKEYLDFALQIHSDMLFHCNFPTREMDEERQAVVEEINISEDTPFSTAYRTMINALYRGHPYERQVLGTKENVLNLPRDSVYTYYKKYYTPNNMVMAIVGDINADTTLELVKRYFGSLPKGIIQKDQYLPPEAKPSQRSEIKRDVAQAYLMIGMIGPQASDPHNYAVDILADILGNGESSRLRRTLQNEKRLVNSISMSFDTRKYEGLIYVYATLDTANIQKVETAIKNIFSEIKEKGITEEELLKAKNSIKTNYYAGYEKGLDIADNYAQSESFIGYKFARDYPNNIERVSLAQVAAAARQYLQADSYVLTLVVPK